MTEPIVKMPPVTITVGQPQQFLFRLEDTTADDPPISLTGYTVAWALSVRPFDTAFATGTGEILTDDIGDHAYLEITEAVTATLGDYALPILGGRPSAVFQITLTAPTAANTIIMQSSAIIQGVL